MKKQNHYELYIQEDINLCGIIGFYNKKIKNKKEILFNMIETIQHRGPDNFGFFEDTLCLANARLSIHDISNGNQPFISNSQNSIIVYNGEIYNYKLLKQDLKIKGYKFYTDNDGEILANLYEEYSYEMFNKIDGMFAIAIYDKKEDKLILGRDEAGEKPLYYYFDNNTFVFASEIKAILKYPNIDKSLNYQAIYDIPTFLWVPEPNTIIKNVKVLKPQNYLIYKNNNIEIHNYKNDFSNLYSNFSIPDLIDLTREKVINSIKTRLSADVKIGTFLSGGLDSSIVSSIAAKEIKNLNSFSMQFDNKINDSYTNHLDETEYARIVANKYNINHHIVKVNHQNFLDSLDKFIYYSDQPFAVSSAMGVMMLSEYAKNKDIKVLLSGDGADELFGGYSWYSYLKSKNIKNRHTSFNSSFLNTNKPISEKLDIINSLKGPRKAWAWHYYASEEDKKILFDNELTNNTLSSIRFFIDYKNKSWKEEDFIKHDRNFYMVNEMLTKVDRMCMANSIESRAPFVSKEIMNLVSNLSYNQLIYNGELKYLLKKAFEGILPNNIIYREKHGFNVPIDAWLKNEWSFLVEEAFCSSSMLFKYGLINTNSYKNALKLINDKNRFNGHTIFSFIIIEKWLKEYEKWIS